MTDGRAAAHRTAAVNGRGPHDAGGMPNGLIPPPNITRFLLAGEELRYVDRLHPIVLARPALGVVAAIVVGGLLAMLVDAGTATPVWGIVVGAAVLWLLYRLIRWGRDLLVVTNRRVFEVRSLIISRVVIRPVFRQSVVFVQSPLGEALNYGRVSTQTPTGDRVHTFKMIRDPQAFYEALTDRAI